MKYRKVLLLISVAMLLTLCLFCTWVNAQTAAPVPKASHAGGYYSEAFYLELTAPSNGVIHYTTDGTTPCADSPVYSQPLLIQDRSQEANVYTSVQNVVYDWKAYSPPSDPVKKGTVIRALFINDLGISSEILNETYFVGLSQPAHGYTLSLIFEPSHLFGEDGIYVTGKEYDHWYLTGNHSQPHPPANFEKDLEVPATLQLIDHSGVLLDQPVGLKLQGNTSRGEIKKRFSLYARTEYSGNEFFDYPLFGDTNTHSVMLKYYLSDAIASELLSDRFVSVQKSIPVRVYLNGEYIYDAYMLERYDSAYFRKYFQTEYYQLIKNGIPDPDSTDNSELPPYGEYMFWVSDTDFSDLRQWEQFQKETDVQSYIDWMVANYFFCNIDFRDDHNQVLWRSSFSNKGLFGDTRWRWCIYDIDALAWVENNPDRGQVQTINVFSNNMGKDMQHTTLYTSLKRSPDFCRRFVLSFMDMYNNNFSPARVNKVLAKYKNGNNLDTYYRYFNERPAYATAHLREEFGLSGTIQTVTITAQSQMGSVVVNTSQIDLSSGSWTGSYFTDYPITVTAQPLDGYEFLGWKGAATGPENTVTVCVDGGILLEAVFAPVK